MKITFVYQSCFCVEMEHCSMIFDYWKGALPALPEDKPLYVFSSHGHPDHFNAEIFSLTGMYQNVRYILSDDIEPQLGPLADRDRIVFVGAGDSLTVGQLEIKTYFSTDAGVAFLVRTEDRSLFHFGDLNWWHWEGEAEKFNREQKEYFQREIEKLKDEDIDVSFGPPVDPRLEENHWLGMDWFMRHTKAAKAFPMHFFDDFTMPVRFIASDRAADYRNRLVCIEHENQEFIL